MTRPGHSKYSTFDKAPARFPRTRRVNQVLRQVVAEELERFADVDERLRLVTVTSVDTAPDLRNATIYVGHLDAETKEALEECRIRMQRVVADQVRMKRTPKLRFAADPAVAAGEQVEEVLRRIAATSDPGASTEPSE